MITTKELVPFKKKVSVLVEEVKGIEIRSDKDMVTATVTLSEINKYLDSVKEVKEKLTKPANEILKNARTMFKPVIEPAEEAVVELRGKMSVYQTVKVRENQAEANAIASRVGEGKGKFKFETAVRKIDELPVPQKEVATDSGLVQFRETPTLKITNSLLIPREYLVVNESLVLKDLKAGKVIPGAEIEIIQTPVNYR